MNLLLLISFGSVYSKCTTSTKTPLISITPPLIPHTYTIIQVSTLQEHFQHIVLAKYSNSSQVNYNETSQEWSGDNDFSTANSWIFMNESSSIVVNPTQTKSESLYISLLLCDYMNEHSVVVKIISDSTSYCPNNCNNNGKCSDGECICNNGFIGPDCTKFISELPLEKNIILKLSSNTWNSYFVVLKNNEKLSISVKNKTSGDFFAFFKNSDTIGNLPSLVDYEKSFYFNTGDELDFSSNQTYVLVSFFCDSLEDCNAQIYAKEKNGSSGFGVNNIIAISLTIGLSMAIIIVIIVCRINRFYTGWNANHKAQRIAQDIMFSFPENQWVQNSNCLTCSICFEDFDKDTMTRVFNCGHMFHTECIDKWICLNPTCPTCKNQLLAKNK
ncbi:hypothetical protein SteCoe_20332 [Stentor coeruleus]|uniref:RING-type domain-containing protein n=1 Tax=Stentor coeruleus TaxID=5963 RepID=A0A1R2BRZ7_9CILI|nr:hypothetical protein SteCoe_20332 [Stentor coeruleus]